MDLFCELTVVNHSELTLHVKAQGSTHGSWDFHGTHLIHPEGFGRFTGKDPAGAAAGSEGWVTFADEAGCTFSLAYCCSYKNDGNYAFLVESSPLLDVTLRFAHEVPPVAAAKTWGEAAFPQGGHPLGILVYVEQRPAKKSLAVLTYNAHLFEGAKDAPADVLHRDQERAAELLRRLAAADPDVICLEGAWTLARAETLAPALAAYPFVFPALTKETASGSPHTWISWFQGLRFVPIFGNVIFLGTSMASLADISLVLLEAVSASGGLLILSRYPLEDGRYTEYPGFGSGNAPLYRRGLLEATVKFPADARTPAFLRIGATHAPIGAEAARSAICEVAAPKVFADSNRDRLLLGDFHLPTSDATERQALDRALGGHGAGELVHRFHPDLDAAHTEWPAENGLAWALSAAASYPPPRQEKERRDFVYFAPRQGASFLTPASVSIPRDWEVSGRFSALDRTFDALPLSDHFPVLSRFDVAVPGGAPYPRFLGHEECPVTLAEIEAGKYSFALPSAARTTPDADLYCVRRTGNSSGRIELRVLEGAKAWKRFKAEIPTRLLPSEEASYAAFLVGDYHGRDTQDLFALKRGARLIVQVLDSRPPAGNPYWDFLLERGTPIEASQIDDFELFLGHYNSDGTRPDLFCVKHRNTSRGRVEIHILSGTHEYQKFSLQTETTLPVDPAGRFRFGVARFRRAQGNSDVFALKPGARNLQVQVFDGTRGYAPLPSEFETPLSAADLPNFEFRFGDCAQAALSGPLYGLKRKNTGGGRLEVHSIGRQGI